MMPTPMPKPSLSQRGILQRQPGFGTITVTITTIVYLTLFTLSIPQHFYGIAATNEGNEALSTDGSGLTEGSNADNNIQHRRPLPTTIHKEEKHTRDEQQNGSLLILHGKGALPHELLSFDTAAAAAEGTAAALILKDLEEATAADGSAGSQSTTANSRAHGLKTHHRQVVQEGTGADLHQAYLNPLSRLSNAQLALLYKRYGEVGGGGGGVGGRESLVNPKAFGRPSLRLDEDEAPVPEASVGRQDQQEPERVNPVRKSGSKLGVPTAEDSSTSAAVFSSSPARLQFVKHLHELIAEKEQRRRLLRPIQLSNVNLFPNDLAFGEPVLPYIPSNSKTTAEIQGASTIVPVVEAVAAFNGTAFRSSEGEADQHSPTTTTTTTAPSTVRSVKEQEEEGSQDVENTTRRLRYYAAQPITVVPPPPPSSSSHLLQEEINSTTTIHPAASADNRSTPAQQGGKFNNNNNEDDEATQPFLADVGTIANITNELLQRRRIQKEEEGGHSEANGSGGGTEKHHPIRVEPANESREEEENEKKGSSSSSRAPPPLITLLSTPPTPSSPATSRVVVVEVEETKLEASSKQQRKEGVQKELAAAAANSNVTGVAADENKVEPRKVTASAASSSSEEQLSNSAVVAVPTAVKKTENWKALSSLGDSLRVLKRRYDQLRREFLRRLRQLNARGRVRLATTTSSTLSTSAATTTTTMVEPVGEELGKKSNKHSDRGSEKKVVRVEKMGNAGKPSQPAEEKHPAEFSTPPSPLPTTADGNISLAPRAKLPVLPSTTTTSSVILLPVTKIPSTAHNNSSSSSSNSSSSSMPTQEVVKPTVGEDGTEVGGELEALRQQLAKEAAVAAAVEKRAGGRVAARPSWSKAPKPPTSSSAFLHAAPIALPSSVDNNPLLVEWSGSTERHEKHQRRSSCRQAINCDFEAGDLCEWERLGEQEEESSSSSSSSTPTEAGRRRVKKHERAKVIRSRSISGGGNNSNNVESNKRENVHKSWHNWEGFFSNRPDGIARAEIFSRHNRRFAGVYLRSGEKAAIYAELPTSNTLLPFSPLADGSNNNNNNSTTKTSPSPLLSFSYSAWEEAPSSGIRMQVLCCQGGGTTPKTQEMEGCSPAASETTATKEGSSGSGSGGGRRRWKYHQAECPQRSEGVVIVCANEGEFFAACGVDNIRVLEGSATIC